MNKSELVSVIAQKLDISQKEAHLFVNTMLESIAEVLIDNEEINLQNFGGFKPKQRKVRLVRNPKNGDPCQLEPIRTIKFRPSRTLIGRMN
ncbi:HU family DNA-binding protein [Parabacteroides sp.]